MGRIEPQLNGFEGGIETDLNYFFSSQCDRVLWRLERESNRSGTAVNQATILLQHHELPPLNPATSIKIDHQNIFIGFGGSRSSPEGGGGRRGRV